MMWNTAMAEVSVPELGVTRRQRDCVVCHEQKQSQRLKMKSRTR